MRAYYEARAREYDDWWLARGAYAPAPDGWEKERDELFAVIRSLSPRRTLDVACGTGLVTRLLPGEVVGLDQSASMLSIASAYVEVVRGDALELPFDDGSFERVFTSHLYGHLEEEDRVRFLAEARRVAPELVVVDAALHGGDERAEWQERRLEDGSRWRIFKRFFTPERLRGELGGGRVLHSGRWFVAVASP